MPLKSNALITVEEYKELAVISEAEEAPNVQIEAFINYASQYIEKYTGRKFVTLAADFDEYFTGDSTRLHYTKYWPLVSTISTIYYLNNNVWTTALTGANFTQDNENGELKFTDGAVFNDAIEDYYKISYKYGWTQKDMPDDLKLVCASIAALRRSQFANRLHGVASRSTGNQSMAYKFDLDDWVMEILDGYKRRH